MIPDWLETDACPSWLHDHRWVFNPCAMSPELVRQARAVYYGMITHLDHQLGRLFGFLKQQGLWENTIVVYTSDHGDQMGDYHDFHKQSFYEGPGRVPYLVRFPGSFGFAKGEHSEALVDLSDLYPTFLDIAGSSITGGLDGQTLLPLLRGDTVDHKAFLHGQSVHNHMIRTKDHKYLYFGEDGREQVFAMTGDRRDDVDLSSDHELTGVLRKALTDHLQDEDNGDFKDGVLFNRGSGPSRKEDLRAVGALGWRP